MTEDASAKTPADPAPRGVLGRYRITGEIAHGAMGVIYKARDPLIDRVVAIKTIALGLSDAEAGAFERRFFREAKSAGRLNHPNVVTIYDVGKSGDVAYIAMEFLQGRSLREILDSGVVLPPEQVADIGAQIADGLAFAHRQQVVHRDVKPANIMVLDTGGVKITDFGIALLPTATRTLTASVFGSPRYTSPEQVMGRDVDGRSDIFSLGAVIYEMLTGLPPFSADDLNGILRQVLTEPTPPPSVHNPTLPPAFDHIVGKALAKDPNDRYQDAAAMAADLRNYASLEFATPGIAPLPPLEHPTVADKAPDIPEWMPDPGDARPAPAAAPDAAARRTKLRLGIGIGGGVLLLAVAFALGLRSTPDAPTRPVTASAEPARGSPAPPAMPITDTPMREAPAAPAPAAAPSAVRPTPPANLPVTAAAPALVSPSPAAPSSASTAMTPTPMASPAPASAAGATPPARAESAPTGTADGAKPAAPAKPPGRIALAIAPWGEVIVDGRKRGLSPPLQEVRVAPGKHTVEIRNSTFPPYTLTVDVPANGEVRIKHKFP
jgi:tRNA A-37 threonylcarbamoyl transferase component Bud32